MEDRVVKAIVEQCDVPEEQVRAVLTALEVIRDGASVGTVVQDPSSGAVACRVVEDGVHLWKVTALDGGEWRDMQPRLKGWKVLVEPK